MSEPVIRIMTAHFEAVSQTARYVMRGDVHYITGLFISCIAVGVATFP